MTAEVERMTLKDKLVWSEKIAEAGNLIPAAFRDRAKVLVAVEYGQMLGVHPLVAMNDIYVIEGTPTMSAHLMSATVRTAGHKLRVRSTGTWGDGSFRATATLVRSDDPEPFEATWTQERAQRAGLLGKLNWKNYPEAMCKARAISEVCRDGASEALMGIKYTAEEISDIAVTEAGDPVDVTMTATRRHEPAAATQRAEDVLDAELIDETTGEVRDQPTPPPYSADEADEWAAQIDGVPEVGHPDLPHAIESDTLAGIYLRAQKAGVLDHLVDDPARVPQPKTVQQLLDERREQLQAAARARQSGAA